MRSRRRAALVVGLPAALLLLAYLALHDYVRGAAFVVKAAGMHGVARTAAEWEAGTVAERAFDDPLARRHARRPGGTIPGGTSHRAFLLVPGVHASGVDEPRLVGFARDLASMGHAVVTIGPPDLARYVITPETTDAIEDAARWLSSQRDLAPDGRIGMMGISFAGGLSIVAAGRASLRDRVAAVVSLGGHGDLPRTLRYLCTGVQPDGERRPPHDYGVVIILLGVVDRVVPPDQVDALRAALLTFLEASRLDLVDKAQSAATFERATRARRHASGTGAYADGLRQPARRRQSRPDPAAARLRHQRLHGAVAVSVAAAGGARVPAARVRGQRHSRGGIDRAGARPCARAAPRSTCLRRRSSPTPKSTAGRDLPTSRG